MSSALAIAGVTAVLRDLLNDGLVNGNVSGAIGTSVLVTALPPDRIGETNGQAPTQLNLFLHQVTHNAAWRNVGMPGRDADGARRSNPPLALDLHYLLTAYGAEELHAEILLGYAMQLIHEMPVLRSEAVRTALDPGPDVGTTLPPALRALAECGLADQVEQIRITPEPMDGEEMSRLWSAIGAKYRPTTAYTASVVLIEAQRPLGVPLPVLRRDIGLIPEAVPAVPTLTRLAGPSDDPVAAPGETLALIGGAFGTAPYEALLLNPVTGEAHQIAAAPGPQPDRLSVALPSTLTTGLHSVALRNADGRRSNRLGFLVRPALSSLTSPVARDAGGEATLTVGFVPAARAGQAVRLIVADREVAPAAFAPPASSLTFEVPDAPIGTFPVRVRIDGFDSDPIDRSTTPPSFRADAQVTIT